MFDPSANGKRLNKLRIEAHETVAEAAEAVGVSIASFSQYEQGAKTPRDEVKLRIASHYSTPVHEIFFVEESTKSSIKPQDTEQSDYSI